MSDPDNTTDFLRRLITDVSGENVELKCKIAKLEQERMKLLLRIDVLTSMCDESDFALEATATVLMQSVVEQINPN